MVCDVTAVLTGLKKSLLSCAVVVRLKKRRKKNKRPLPPPSPVEMEPENLTRFFLKERNISDSLFIINY
jgi:hypothetical protein